MRRWLIGGGIVAALLVAGVVVAIVAGGSADGSADDPEDQMAAFRECLTEQGVELPEPPEGAEGPMILPGPGEAPSEGGDVPVPEGGTPEGPVIRPQIGGDAETQEAFEACSDLLPETPEGAIRPGFNPAPQN